MKGRPRWERPRRRSPGQTAAGYAARAGEEAPAASSVTSAFIRVLSPACSAFSSAKSQSKEAIRWVTRNSPAAWAARAAR